MKKLQIAALLMVFACFALIGCSGSDSTNTPTGTVSGKIVDRNGVPIPGITVLLLNNGFQPYTSAAAAAKFGSYYTMNAANRAACVSAATTDTDGAYSIAGVPYGTYSVLPAKTNAVEQFISTADMNPTVVTVGPAVSVANFRQRMAGGLLTMSSPGTASDPIFFIHISDTHFGLKATTPDEEEVEDVSGGKALMTALLSDIAPVIRPLAIIHTGDIVEKGYDETSWKPYTDLFLDYQLGSPTKYIDIIGNHDVKLDTKTEYNDGFDNFILYGRTDTRYGYTTLNSQSGSGVVRLIRTNTAASTLSNASKRNIQNVYGCFTDFQQQNLLSHPDRNMAVALNVVLGHSPVAENYLSTPNGYIEGSAIYLPGTKDNDVRYMYQITDGNGRMKQLINAFQAPIYLSGHVHKPGLEWLSNKTLVVRADNFGFDGKTANFYLVAYDLDTKSPAAKLVQIDATDASPGFSWPVVFITAPANSSLGGTNANPNAQAFTTNQTITLKTMVFSPEKVTSVGYSLDNEVSSPPLTSTSNSGRIWEADIPLAGLARGSHKITVKAKRSNGTTGTDTISILVQ